MNNRNKDYESGFQEGWEYAMKLLTQYWRPNEKHTGILNWKPSEKHIEILKNIFRNKDITGPDYVLNHYNIMEIRNNIEVFEAEIRSLEIGDEFESIYGLYGLIIGFSKSDPNNIIYIAYSNVWNEFYYGEIDMYTIRKRKRESENGLKTYLKGKLTPKEEDKEVHWEIKRDDNGKVYLTCSNCFHNTYEMYDEKYSAGKVLFPNYCSICGKKMTNGRKEIKGFIIEDEDKENG